MSAVVVSPHNSSNRISSLDESSHENNSIGGGETGAAWIVLVESSICATSTHSIQGSHYVFDGRSGTNPGAKQSVW